jgi:H+/Cl- antiporter ClcA
MRRNTRLLIRIGDALGTLVIAACAAYALGELFIWFWAPPPTPDNSSPPPEAFLFVWGAVIGFFGVLFGRLLLAPLWLRHRRKLG